MGAPDVSPWEWEAQHFLWGLEHDECGREESARHLLMMAAVLLEQAQPFPPALADWLAGALRGVAGGERPQSALGLTAPRGRRRDDRTVLERVAHMHALVALGVAKEAAADLVCQHFGLTEVSGVVKAYNTAARRWRLHGPTISGLTDAECQAGETLRAATLHDFARAWPRGIVVQITPSSGGFSPGYLFGLAREFMSRVANSGAFAHMD
jgi:hypothetical protein